MTTSTEIDRLLGDLREEKEGAFDALLEKIYPELRAIAHRQLRRQSPDATLRTTALVNELFLRLAEGRQDHWQDRAHFLAVAATAMRQILVSSWRARMTKKRGGESLHLSFEDIEPGTRVRVLELLEIHTSLERLEAIDPRLSRVVELRFFGGLTFPEIGEVMGFTERTAKRHWRSARAFLGTQLESPGPADG